MGIGRILTLAFIAALIALFPMRIALSLAGGQAISAKSVSGPVWHSRIEDLAAGPVRAGNVTARLRLLPLLVGRLELGLERDGADPPLEGAIVAGSGGRGVKRMSGALGFNAPAPFSLMKLDLSDATLRFSGGRCVGASGGIRIAADPGLVKSLSLASTFSGQLKCADGLAVAQLASQSGLERLRIEADEGGIVAASLFLTGLRGEAGPALALAGFKPVPGGYRLDFALRR